MLSEEYILDTYSTIRSKYQDVDDERNELDGDRKGSFKRGCKKASMSDDVLKYLTWESFGYQLRRRNPVFGKRGEEYDAVREFVVEVLDNRHHKMVAYPVPSSAKYRDAIESIKSDKDWSKWQLLLEYHFRSHDQTITLKELAREFGRIRGAEGDSCDSINKCYCNFGRAIRGLLKYRPSDLPLGSFVLFERKVIPKSYEWQWTLRPEISAALVELGWKR